MNYQQTPGGALKPIWHPPIPMEWIVSFLLIIGASNIEALPPLLHKTLMHPAGFFFTFLFAIAAFDAGYKIVPFAILFVLLLIWVIYERNAEGFQVSGTIDWVQNNSRWFSEVVLKEKPMGIKENAVNTYPVQSDSQPSTR